MLRRNRGEERINNMESKITLLLDGENASKQAQEILNKANIPFKKVYGHGVNLPKAQYMHVSYNGISGIQFLVRSMGK
jgi:hypothetical protein